MKVLLSFTILALVAHFTAAASEPDCNPGNPDHRPHPTDCNKYYTCSNGVAILQKCPPGLLWSVEMETCDLPENTKRETEISSTTAATTVTTSGTTNPTSTTAPKTTPPASTSMQSPNTAPAGPVNECPPVEDPAVIIRYPHATNCEFYYKCEQGHPHLFTCSSTVKKHFSPTKRVCLSIDVAGCDSCPTVDDVTDVIRLPHENNCHYYYLCQYGHKTLFPCQMNIWHFSRMDRVCMPQAYAKCTLR